MLEFINILQPITHYSLHIGVPGLLAWIFFRKYWKTAWGIMIATMLVDIDHLLADPIFLADRCGIGFHPLHSYYVIGVYLLMLLIPNVYLRIVSVGLIFHMFTDFQDCLWMSIR